ncbi:MAG: hypothetical protein A2Z03_11310 [Chloroflexi bacterium RBG_16_56_8]|nr:MAG: hypothetical protein A2Z03_11310 [Chloroflexi bacterium RBG_16_56_8]
MPGNIRQRIKRAIRSLGENAKPSESKILDITEIAPDLEPERLLMRIRINRWRIVYAITESEKAIDVLAVRKRPPYDYQDLEQLLNKIK